MWEESQAENTKLRLELSGVRSDLETARHQLEGAEKRVTNIFTLSRNIFISEPNTFAHYNLMRHNSSSQVMKNNAVTDQEKREKKIVVKKLAEMEEELKVRVCINVTKFGTQYYWNYFQLLALSENLTDQVRSLLSFDGFIPIIKTDRFRYFAYIFTFQTLDQLKSDNCRLRDENTALLRVIAKMSK